MSGKSIDLSHVAQAWMHSHEEDTPTTTVYRPAAYPFPPSRGRKGFHLQPGGVLATRNPGPTDRTTVGDGTWKLTGQQLELSPDGQPAQVLQIESAEPDRLVIQKASR